LYVKARQSATRSGVGLIAPLRRDRQAMRHLSAAETCKDGIGMAAQSRRNRVGGASEVHEKHRLHVE
jgi:hypothetical protein